MPFPDSLGAADPQPKAAAPPRELLAQLREQFPAAPFLTLGQTVWWDEPLKAVFCRLLNDLPPAGGAPGGARIVAGVHDTDYFAKLPALALHGAPFVMLRHNDGDTRGLWSAAGEISALFGAEIVPSRSQFTADGVAFATATRAYRGGAEALLNQETEAPLWRALVHTEPHPLLAAEVRCRDIAPVLLEQLRWALGHSLRAMGCDSDLSSEQPCSSRETARRLLSWVEEFVALAPDATLSELYRDLIPRIWALVGAGVCDLETTASMELFRFNGRTASLPRFSFVDIFLNPATRALARRAYDEAVRGSGIYTLKGFGEGALPFDVVIPGFGRGTLRLLDGALSIETEEPLQICDNCDPESVATLAAILEDRFGPDVVLVGKAVTLISMLAAEFIIVFHEEASSYTRRTRSMNAALRATGIKLPMHPILRLKHAAWDALEGVDATFVLPGFLQEAFGSATVTATEFAARWQGVANEGDARRARLSAANTPASLLALLAEFDPASWQGRLLSYHDAEAVLQHQRTQTQPFEQEIGRLRVQARSATVAALGIEAAMGKDYQARVAPLKTRLADLREAAAMEEKPLKGAAADEVVALQEQIGAMEAERRAYTVEIAVHRAQARELVAQARNLVKKKLELERSPNSRAARAVLLETRAEAELQRLRLVRDAIRAGGALRYTNRRPTAWWLPLVSPDGRWFDNMTARVQLRLEEV